MNERDQMAARSDSGFFVDQPRASGFEPVEGGADIGDAIADVMKTRATFREKFPDRRFSPGRFEQFHARLADGQHRNVHPLVLHGLTRNDGETEGIAVKCKRVFDRRHSNPKMVDFHKRPIIAEAQIASQRPNEAAPFVLETRLEYSVEVHSPPKSQFNPVDIAVGADGRVFAVAGGPDVVELTDANPSVYARLVAPDASALGPPAASSIVVRPDGALMVLDSHNACIWEVCNQTATVVAGSPQPRSLTRRATRADGARAAALFRAPDSLAVCGPNLVVAENDSDGSFLRLVSPTDVTTVRVCHPALHRISGMAGNGDGQLVLVDASSPVACLFLFSGRADLDVLSGDPHHPGISDGDAHEARFLRPTAVAALPTGGWLVADGPRIREVSAEGAVHTVAGAGPGSLDGEDARFGLIRALACGPDGRVAILDAENRTIRQMDRARVVSSMLRFLPESHGTEHPTFAFADLTDDELRRMNQRFADALVDGNLAAALVVMEHLLAHADRAFLARPDRRRLPVSPASARVGRALATTWARDRNADRSRLGAFCLWLIRIDERASAPVDDARLLVAETTGALEDEDYDHARQFVAAIDIAFGRLARRRDRLQVAAAYRDTDCTRRAAALLGSVWFEDRMLAIDIFRQSRDIRTTPLLASIALERPDLAVAVLATLREIWESAAYSASQIAELRSSLRFSRTTVDRLLTLYGPRAFGSRGLRLFVRATTGSRP